MESSLALLWLRKQKTPGKSIATLCTELRKVVFQLDFLAEKKTSFTVRVSETFARKKTEDKGAVEKRQINAKGTKKKTENKR